MQAMLTEGSADPGSNKNEAIRLASANGHIKGLMFFFKKKRKKGVHSSFSLVVRLLLEDDRVDGSDMNCRYDVVIAFFFFFFFFFFFVEIYFCLFFSRAVAAATEGGFQEIAHLLLSNPRVAASFKVRVLKFFCLVFVIIHA